MFDILAQDIKYLKGVGPNRAKLLNDELGIYTLHDLLYFFPYKYIDRTKIYQICDLQSGMPHVQLKGRILNFETEGEGRKRRLKAFFSDKTGVVELVWFQGIKFIQQKLKIGIEYIVLGKPSIFNGVLSLSHPDIDIPEEDPFANKRLQPYYRLTERMKRSGISSKTIETIMRNLFAQLKVPLSETLPAYILSEQKLPGLDTSVRTIHFPIDAAEVPHAQMRLKFDELFYLQLNILRYAKDRQLRYKGLIFNRVGDNFMHFYTRNLPFELTEAQKRVIKEIRRDMGNGRQMNRLLQGDVGSGKTMVALMTMLIALDNGYQACMMAPTEILAEQHLVTVKRMLQDMNIRVELLTGMVKGKKRNAILQDLLKGEIQILIGTHAVLEDTVIFANLGMVVIDEQHRFGVAQRAKLWMKNENPPHVLVMTATPIPRTLAMTVYGDLDCSVIDELPPGRKPVKTLHMYDNNTVKLYEGMKRELAVGHQIYVVYPLIKESEKLDIKNLEEGYENICNAFSEYRVGKLHGKMKSQEKEDAMQKFIRKETQILVSTTVIEVGVNVPNASVMVIENAERFGLSQLHQLRGRVGRGADQSYCILVTSFKLSENTRKRMQIMVDSNDGFELAEEDLRLRGPGDLEGTQQSGIAFDLKIANITRDNDILQWARRVASLVVENDPEGVALHNDLIWKQLKQIRKTQVDWSFIS